MRFDSHQHFWKLANRFTDWPTSDLAPIYRDFGPDDLRPKLEQAQILGTILVQAAPSLAETDYCLAIADKIDFVEGVVGWIDFEAEDALDQMDRLASSPLLKGLRPMVQSIDEPGWLLREEFGNIFKVMIERGLSLDGLVLARQVTDLSALARRYSTLPIVIDHAGKPPIASGERDEWADDILKLAENPNVHCKLSGLWTEAGSDCSEEAIQPWLDHLLASFGPHRLIWGSDWPVLELAGHYGDWVKQCERMLSNLNEQDRVAIFGGNGRQFYGID